MPAILTANGIQFDDSTALNSRRDIYPLSTAWVVYQQFAPTGWTKVTTNNNKALRVVSGNGGGSGGSVTFSSVFPNGTTPISAPVSGSNGVNGYAVTIPEIASHDHGNGGSVGLNANPSLFNPDGSFATYSGGDVTRPPVGNSTWSRVFPNSGPDGSNVAHAHPFSGTGTFSTSIDLRVQFIDIIICTFNG